MELRRLRYFVTVAEELHFGRAAERLHMAQQPLSVQIRELEREIGHELFERYANRIRLTAAGQAFLGESRAILERSERAVDIARRAATGEVGVVRVGFCSAARERVLPDLVRALKVDHPSIGVHLRELDQRAQLLAIERDELDVGFVYRPFDERTFASFDLFEESAVVAVPLDHRFAGETSVSLRELSSESLVVLASERHSALAPLVHRIPSDPMAEPSPRIIVHEAETALALVARGLGVALLTEGSAGQRPDTKLVPLDVAEHLTFAAVWSKLAPARITRARFLSALQEMQLATA